MGLSQLAHLTQKEAAVLKFVIEKGVDKDSRIQFDLGDASKELGLQSQEICDSLREISKKGFITIHRIPAPKETVQRILEEIEDVDIQFVVGALRKEDFRKKRKKLLSELAAAGHKQPVISLGELQNIETNNRELLNRLDKLEKLKEDPRSSSDLINKLRNEYNSKLSESQKLLSEFRPGFWHRVSELASELDEVERVVQEITLRMELGEYNEETYEAKLAEIGSKQDKLRRKIALLLGARAEAWIPAVPEDLAEELEVLDARKEIGEIPQEVYDKFKADLLGRIEELLLKGDHKTTDVYALVSQYVKALKDQVNLVQHLSSRQVIAKDAADIVLKGTKADLDAASEIAALVQKSSKK